MRPIRMILLAAAWLSSTAHAQEPEDTEHAARARIEQLEERVRALEEVEQDDPLGLAEWMERIRFSGSANVGYFGGEDQSFFDEASQASFNVWDARFFVDADLGSDVLLGETKVVRNLGFFFEWDLMRLGHSTNRVGELYVDFQGVFDSDWVNFQLGRFQLPVGEAYLRFSRGYKDKPFISNTFGGPWYWDEGIRLYGAASSGDFGYVASLTNGDTSLNFESDENKQLTLRLFADPTDWLHLSVSGLRSGSLGSPTSPASGSLWWGEAWPRALGSGTDVPTFDAGMPIPDAPNEIENTTLLGADVVITHQDLLRVWLAYGVSDVFADGPRLYDRRLQYWIAEVILGGRLCSEELNDLYLGLRADGLGTYDRDEGYLLHYEYASSLGYNMKSIEAYSIGPGWHMTDNVTLRLEYTFVNLSLVRGVGPAIRDASQHADFYAIEVAAHF